RRLQNADGSFAGTMATSVDPEVIGAFYKTIELGEEGSVILRDLDGVILASGGIVASVAGRQVMQPALREALPRSPIGYYWGGGAVDGINRLVSYRQSPMLPIIMMVGVTDRAIFANYNRIRSILLAAAGILTAFLLVVAFVNIRHQYRLDRSADARRLAERRLERAKRFLDTIIQKIPPSGVVKHAETQRFELVNRAYEQFIGRPRDQLIGKTVHDVFSPEVAEAIVGCDRSVLKSGNHLLTSEIVLSTPTGDERVVTTTRLMVRDDTGAPSHLIVVMDDITERRPSESKIVYMAHHDVLTELPNRALFQERLELGLARARRGESLAVLWLDLDDFKSVNDTLGHPVGDALLKAVAGR